MQSKYSCGDEQQKLMDHCWKFSQMVPVRPSRTVQRFPFLGSESQGQSRDKWIPETSYLGSNKTQSSNHPNYHSKNLHQISSTRNLYHQAPVSQIPQFSYKPLIGQFSKGTSGATFHPQIRETGPQFQICDMPQIWNERYSSSIPGFYQTPTRQCILQNDSNKGTCKQIGEGEIHKTQNIPFQKEKMLSPMQHSTQFTQCPPQIKNNVKAKVFLSVNVHGVKTWSQFKQQLLPVFELIGKLDSQVTSSLASKSFVLKDGQGQHIDCVFYETDRKLPILRRSLLYRIVGEYNIKQNKLLCVSLRETNNKELQVHRRLVAVCNVTMKRRSGII